MCVYVAKTVDDRHTGIHIAKNILTLKFMLTCKYD